MSQPFIFISTFRLKQRKLEAFTRMCQGLVEFVESNEPRVIAFNLYASDDGNEVSNVQVHPDAASVVSYMRLLHEHISGAGGEESSIDVTTSNQIYGIPNNAVLEMIEEFDPGVPLTIKPYRSPDSPAARRARRTAQRDGLPGAVGLTSKPRRSARVFAPTRPRYRRPPSGSHSLRTRRERVVERRVGDSFRRLSRSAPTATADSSWSSMAGAGWDVR